MGSLANLFNLNLTTDLPSIQKTGGGYLAKLEMPAHSGNRTVTQTFHNVLTGGTTYILINIDNTGWKMEQLVDKSGNYSSNYWWHMEYVVNVSGKNIVATIRATNPTGSGIPSYSFPATSMEVAFIEMSEPV